MNVAPSAPLRRSRSPALALVVFLGYLTFLWAAHAKATLTRIRVVPLDALTGANLTTELAVRAEAKRLGHGWFPWADQPLDLELPRNPEHRWHGVTGADGWARIEVPAPSQPGLYAFAVEISAKPDTVLEAWPSGLLAVAGGEELVLICRVEGCLTSESKGSRGAWDPHRRPLPGATQVLRQLDDDWRLVLLTDLPIWFRSEIRVWLGAHGFPRMPLLGAGEGASAALDGERLRSWSTRFRIGGGIGASAADCDAFRSLGVPHVTLGEAPCTRPDNPVRCDKVSDWTEISAFFHNLEK